MTPSSWGNTEKGWKRSEKNRHDVEIGEEENKKKKARTTMGVAAQGTTSVEDSELGTATVATSAGAATSIGASREEAVLKRSATVVAASIGEDTVDALHSALENNDLDEVTKMVLKKKEKIDEVGSKGSRYEGKTALHVAVMERKLGFASVLLRNGANKEKEDGEGNTPLFYGYMESLDPCNDIMLELLLREGCNYMRVSKNGTSLLHLGCRDDNLAFCKYLLSEIPEEEDKLKLLNCKDVTKKTALFYACTRSIDEKLEVERDIVAFLLQSGATYNNIDGKGSSVMHVAAKEGNNPLCCMFFHGIKTIEGKKAILRQKDAKENIPLHLSCANGNVSLAQKLLDNDATESDSELMEEMVCSRDGKGNLPIHLACREGHQQVLKMLLTGRIMDNEELLKRQLMAENANKEIPLHLACINGNVSLAEELLYNDAIESDSELMEKMVCSCDWEENLPIHLACKEGHHRMVKMLLTGPTMFNYELLDRQLRTENCEGEQAWELAANYRCVAVMCMEDNGQWDRLTRITRKAMINQYQSATGGVPSDDSSLDTETKRSIETEVISDAVLQWFLDAEE